MVIGPGVVTCGCGWTDTFTPPLVIDNPRQSIGGTPPSINCMDSADKRLRHHCTGEAVSA